MATIIFRYDKYRGIDAKTEKINTISHSDIGDVADLAAESMHYCIEAGIIGGDDNGNLLPKNNATRAETASVITRLQ